MDLESDPTADYNLVVAEYYDLDQVAAFEPCIQSDFPREN
jgi:hypothetical protein